MADRIDHFARIRAETEPKGEPPEGSPVVSPDILEWMELRFGTNAQNALMLGATSETMLVNAQGCALGYAAVLAHLRTLVRTA